MEWPNPRPTLTDARQRSVRTVAQGYLNVHQERYGAKNSRVNVEDVIALMKEYGLDNPEFWDKDGARPDGIFVSNLLLGLEKK